MTIKEYMEGVLEKVTTLCLVLENLKSSTKDDAMTYEHVNAIVMLYESLALQDTFLRRNLKTEDEVEALEKFGLLWLGQEVIDYCKQFRLKLFHVKKYYCIGDYEKLRNGLTNGMINFTSKLSCFVAESKSRLESMIKDCEYPNSWPEIKISLLDLFNPISTFEDLGLGIDDPLKMKDVIEKMLQAAEIFSVDRREDVLKIEEAIYYYSVSMYNMLCHWFGIERDSPQPLKKYGKDRFIQALKDERGMYIHQFHKMCTNDNQELSLKNRRLVMIQFCRSWISHLYKFLVATEIYQSLTSAELTASTLEGAFQKSRSLLKLDYNVFETFSQHTERQILEKHFKNYLLLMAPIDNEESIQSRKSNYVELNGYIRREIYEGFFSLKNTRIQNPLLYLAQRNALDIKLTETDSIIAKDTFLEMEKLFIGEADTNVIDDQIVIKLITIVQDFCANDTSLRQIVDNIPEKRRLLLTTVGGYEIHNLHEKVIATFCASDMKDLFFENVQDAFKDAAVLHILEALTVSRPKLLKSILVKKNRQIKYLAPLFIQLFRLQVCKKTLWDKNIAIDLVKILLEDLHVEENIECLRSFISFLVSDKDKKSNDILDATIGTIFHRIGISTPENLQYLKGIFIHQQNESAPIFCQSVDASLKDLTGKKFELDLDCIEAFISVTSQGDLEKLFIMITLALKKCHYFHSNRLKGMNLLKSYIQDQHSVLNLVSLNVRMDVIGLCATFAAKIKIAKKTEEDVNLVTADLAFYQEKSKVFREYLFNLENQLFQKNFFENLYDAAFQASELENNHFLAFEMYSHLLRSILKKSNPQQLENTAINFLPHNYFEKEKYSDSKWKLEDIDFEKQTYSRIELDSNDSYPFVGKTIFAAIYSNPDYRENIKCGKHGDVVNVLKDMAHECYEIAKVVNDNADFRWQYTEASIALYKNSYELDKMQNQSKRMDTKILNPLADKCKIHSEKNHTKEEMDNKMCYMQQAEFYLKEVVMISEKKYLDNHPALVKSKKRLSDIQKLKNK